MGNVDRPFCWVWLSILERTVKYLLWANIAWILSTISSVFFQDEVRAALWVGFALWWLALYATGGLLTICASILLTKTRSRRFSLFALAVAPVVVSSLIHFSGDHWAHVLHFQLNKGYYEAQVVVILAAPPVQRIQLVGNDCFLDDGPPVRVAFKIPGGILDNFTAVVYDPTGRVMEVDQLRSEPLLWKNPNSMPIRRLFGGDLIFAEPLGGLWYRCGFT